MRSRTTCPPVTALRMLIPRTAWRGEPFTMAAGFAAIEREYDDAGRVIVERYYGGDGEKGPRKEGYDEYCEDLAEKARRYFAGQKEQAVPLQ